MLLLNWLDELVLVLLLELLLEPKSDFSRLVRVVVLEESVVEVVSASPAVAVWSGAPIHSAAASRSVARRCDLDGCEKEAGVGMGWRWFCGAECRWPGG